MAKKNVNPKDISMGFYIGHGRQTNGVFDPGTTYRGRTEAEICKPIVQAAVRDLRRIGFKVYTDAFDGNSINMIEQVELSNKKKVDYHCALHLDYYKAPKGTLPIAVSKEGKALAKSINKTVMKRTGMTTRGVVTRTDLYELNATNMPAVIFECGDIDEDYTRLKKADVYGKAVAEGFCNHVGVKYTAEAFKVKTKKKLKVRKEASLTSKVTGYTKEGHTYTIVKTNAKGTRGKLKSGLGWVTITSKYVTRL